MPGRNTTGLPNTDDYNLGRGILYFAPLVNSLPTAYRDLGNATEFTVTVETETLEHQSSRSGLRVTDKEVVVSTNVTVSITLDEINFENLALAFLGETAAFANTAVGAGFAEYEMISSVELGKWYDLKTSGGVRVYNLDAADVDLDNGTDDTDLVAGTDYLLDAELGRVFFYETATAIEAGEAVDITLAAGTAGTIGEVKGLTTSATTGALKFISQNPAAGDAKTEYQVHSVSLKPEGDISLIGDDWTTLQLTGKVEANVIADADSPYITARTVESAT